MTKKIIGYKIKVEAVVEEVKTVGKDWGVVGQEIDSATGKIKDVYDYTPEIEKVVRVESMIYQQSVDMLDMGALVAVVNARHE